MKTFAGFSCPFLQPTVTGQAVASVPPCFIKLSTPSSHLD